MVFEELINGNETATVVNIFEQAVADKYAYMALLTVGFSIAVLIVWYIYRKLAQRDIIKLDLKKYEFEKKWVRLKKFIAVIIYIIKFIIFFPILLFIMYAIVSVSLYILSGATMEIESVLFFSLIIISVIRMLAYIKEDAAREMAKMLPLAMILTLFISGGLMQGNITIPTSEEVINSIYGVSDYFVFVIGLEITLRVLHSIFSVTFGRFIKKEISKDENLK